MGLRHGPARRKLPIDPTNSPMRIAALLVVQVGEVLQLSQQPANCFQGGFLNVLQCGRKSHMPLRIRNKEFIGAFRALGRRPVHYHGTSRFERTLHCENDYEMSLCSSVPGGNCDSDHPDGTRPNA